MWVDHVAGGPCAPTRGILCYRLHLQISTAARSPAAACAQVQYAPLRRAQRALSNDVLRLRFGGASDQTERKRAEESFSLLYKRLL